MWCIRLCKPTALLFSHCATQLPLAYSAHIPFIIQHVVAFEDWYDTAGPAFILSSSQGYLSVRRRWSRVLSEVSSLPLTRTSAPFMWLIMSRNLKEETYIVKSIHNHWRLQNEASILKRYQGSTPSIRPLVDEIIEPSEPSSIVLKYLDTDLLKGSNKRRLSRSDIKKVAKAILLALRVLHQDGLVHTDVKLDNVFVNHGSTGNERFSEIQLGDFGGVVPQDSEFAKDGHLIGAGISRSPEATLQMHWGTPTDVWSFGNAVRNYWIPYWPKSSYGK